MDKFDLYEAIRERVNPEELIDILGLDIDTLVDKLYFEIAEKHESFEFLELPATGGYEYDEDD